MSEQSQTKVVNLKYHSFDIYIGRPSKWSNPYRIGPDGNRETVIRRYEEWILKQDEILADLHELKGKVLGCYCRPHACHGDVLVKLVNSLP